MPFPSPECCHDHHDSERDGIIGLAKVALARIGGLQLGLMALNETSSDGPLALTL